MLTYALSIYSIYINLIDTDTVAKSTATSSNYPSYVPSATAIQGDTAVYVCIRVSFIWVRYMG